MVAAVDRALLLRRFAYGESSLVVHALTEQHGRVHLLAKGAYRPTSRYYAALDLFDTLELTWNASGHELETLREASIAVRRHRVAHDLARYGAALTVLELLSLGAPEHGPAGELFALGTRALDGLVASAAPQRELLAFELAFLRALGLAPALRRCAACDGDAPPIEGRRAAFSAGAGGRLCRACAAEAKAAGRRVGTLPVRVLEIAAAALADGDGARQDLRSTNDLERTRDFVARFLEYHLEGRPKSYARFLAVPSRNHPTP
jgi:DNA repair protein RecO (recombination protein O)